MRRQLHKMGHTGACVSCEAESATIGKFSLPLTLFKLVHILFITNLACCTHARRDQCDYFGYFSDEGILRKISSKN